MKKLFITTGLIIAISIGVAANRIKVLDAGDHSTVVGATVIGKSGIILGITDENGTIHAEVKDFPLTIRSMGYETATLSAAEDSLLLLPATYTLNNVTVLPGERPIIRVVCFAREYSTGVNGADTMQLYCEYMTEAFLQDGKVKGYKGSDAKPHIRNNKRYARLTHQQGDSIFQPTSDHDITALSWFSTFAHIPDKTVVVSPAILAGAEADTIQGKYGPKVIAKMKNKVYTVSIDVLADFKNHYFSPWIFKLFGLTTDLTQSTVSLSFADSGKKNYDIYDYLRTTSHLLASARGKWIKKIFHSEHPVEMETYMELYPVDITLCTIDEYKELRKAKKEIKFQYPQDLEPLAPTVTTLITLLDSKPQSR